MFKDILETAVTVIGVLGGWQALQWLILRKSKKRYEAAVTDEKEVEAEVALRKMYDDALQSQKEHYTERLEEINNSLKDQVSINHELLKDNSCKEEFIQDKTMKIRELNDVIYKLQQDLLRVNDRLHEREMYIEWLEMWHCTREHNNSKAGCTRRQPPQPVPIKYRPFKYAEQPKTTEDDTSENTD